MAVMTVIVLLALGLILLTWVLMIAAAGPEGEDDAAQEKYLMDYSERESRRRLDRARKRRELKQKIFDFWLNLFYPRD